MRCFLSLLPSPWPTARNLWAHVAEVRIPVSSWQWPSIDFGIHPRRKKATETFSKYPAPEIEPGTIFQFFADLFFRNRCMGCTILLVNHGTMLSLIQVPSGNSGTVRLPMGSLSQQTQESKCSVGLLPLSHSAVM